MSFKNLSPKTEITYYGKKVFYLDKNLAQKIEPEQIKLNFTHEDNKTETLH